jgi:hypothetical protein
MQKLSITYKEDGIEKTILRDEIQWHHDFIGAFNNKLEVNETPDIVRIPTGNMIAIAVVHPSEEALKADIKAKVHADIYKEKVHVITQHITAGKHERDYTEREMLMPLEKAFYADTAVQEMGILSPTGGFMRIYQKEYKDDFIKNQLYDLLSKLRK